MLIEAQSHWYCQICNLEVRSGINGWGLRSEAGASPKFVNGGQDVLASKIKIIIIRGVFLINHKVTQGNLGAWRFRSDRSSMPSTPLWKAQLNKLREHKARAWLL